MEVVNGSGWNPFNGRLETKDPLEITLMMSRELHGPRIGFRNCKGAGRGENSTQNRGPPVKKAL